MLKKILKTALAAGMIVGMASTAMADAKVTGSVKAYFGQYNAGSDGYTAHYASVNEANINFKASKGSLTGFAQLEARQDGSELNDSQRWVQWKKDALSVRIGSISNGYGKGFAVVAGTKTSGLASVGMYKGLTGYLENDGLHVGYAISKHMKAGLTLVGSDAGSGMALGFMGHFGAIGVKANSVSYTADDAADATDDTVATATTGIGVKYNAGAFSVSVDSVSKDVGGGATKTSDLGIQARVKAGPGTAIITIGTEETTVGSADPSKKASTNVVYDVPVEKGAGMQFLYLSQANTASGGDAVTKSYMGAGFYAGF